MPGPPVSIGCAVVVTPGAAGPPDSGVITVIPQVAVTASGQPLAVTGSICQMVNSVSGVPTRSRSAPRAHRPESRSTARRSCASATASPPARA